jgi:hypothetical protein
MGCLPHLATQKPGRYCDGMKTNEFGPYIGGKEMVTAKPSWRFKASHGNPRATVRRGPTRRKTRGAAEWSDYRGTSTRGLQWSVHPIDAVQWMLLSLSAQALCKHVSHLTPTARSAMAAHMRQTHRVVHIVYVRYHVVGIVHKGSDVEHQRDNLRFALSTLGVLPFLPPGDQVRLKYRNSFYGSAKQR